MNQQEDDEQLSVISEYSLVLEESHPLELTETIKSDSPVESDLEHQQYEEDSDSNENLIQEEESKEEESPKTRSSSARTMVQQKLRFNLKDENEYLRKKLEQQLAKPVAKKKN